MSVVTGSRGTKFARNVIRYLFVLILSLLVAFPLYWMMVTAVQSPNATLAYPPVFYPVEPNLDGFRQLFSDNPDRKSTRLNSSHRT